LIILSGIDSLYHFCESNTNYPDLFNQIESTLIIQQENYKQLDVEFTNYDLNFTLNDIHLDYLGKAEGFHWFRDLNLFFKIGFKDPNTNERMHNIRVQLLANGIYALGLPNVISLVNEHLLSGYVTGYFPVTRIDLNAFVTYDFRFIDKSMFATRKQSYATISEIGTANTTQTIYVGKPPFRLRIYDKRLEMVQNSSKFDLMDEYFKRNGIKSKQSLFNVEFEMHRAHLRYYKIDTIEDALSNAEQLFKRAMDDIRLIDLDTLKDRDNKNHNKHRTSTLPIWDKIKEAYSIKEFMQSAIPLERIKQKRYMYELEQFEKEFKELTKRGYIHALPISTELFEQYYIEMKDDLGVIR